MTTNQPGRPKPPPPNTSWLDYVTDPSQLPMASEIPYARAELADLRGQLKLQTENVLALMQARDELRKELAALREAIIETGRFVLPPAPIGRTDDPARERKVRWNVLVSRLLAEDRAASQKEGT